MDQSPLARFLRDRRARLTLADVGMPDDGRRRTAGLRREEVAALAHISVSYYARLEQGRGPRPSTGVLDSLSQALGLGKDERSLLFTLAGFDARQDKASLRSEVAPVVMDLIERIPGTAALILDAKYDILACNQLAAALFGDLSTQPPAQRNLARNFFLAPDISARHFGVRGSEDFARFAVSQLRLATKRYPQDRDIHALVTELRSGSREFETLWHQVDSVLPNHQVKRMTHADVGPVELHCDMLLIPNTDQSMVLFTAEPGTRSHSALLQLSNFPAGNPSVVRVADFGSRGAAAG